MKLNFWLMFLLSVFFSASSTADTVYKCNIDGKVVFTDKPCNGKKIQIKTLNRVYKNYTWLKGYSGYKKALNISKEYDIPIFIYFQADWCGYCRKLEKELLNTSKGKKVLSNVIKVRVSPEKSDTENRLFKKFGGKGYPSIYIQKTYASLPKKHYLMSKESGKWKTRDSRFLSYLIGN